MSYSERNLVKLVAKISPWLAPLPSGYFVARAAQAHLELPLAMAIVIGLIIELLGISSVHSWLWLMDWNINKRKSDPQAPAVIAVFLGVIYLIATIGLTVLLEIIPGLATYSPAIFPILAVVGAVNLTLIAQQQQRESIVKQKHIRRGKEHITTHKIDEHIIQNPGSLSDVHKKIVLQSKVNGIREQKKLDMMNRLVNMLADETEISIQDLANQIGCSRTTVYKYLGELSSQGSLTKIPITEGSNTK